MVEAIETIAQRKPLRISSMDWIGNEILKQRMGIEIYITHDKSSNIWRGMYMWNECEKHDYQSKSYNSNEQADEKLEYLSWTSKELIWTYLPICETSITKERERQGGN